MNSLQQLLICLEQLISLLESETLPPSMDDSIPMMEECRDTVLAEYENDSGWKIHSTDVDSPKYAYLHDDYANGIWIGADSITDALEQIAEIEADYPMNGHLKNEGML